MVQTVCIKTRYFQVFRDIFDMNIVCDDSIVRDSTPKRRQIKLSLYVIVLTVIPGEAIIW